MSRPARLGAFVVATLAILVAGVFIVGSKQYLFTSTYHLKTRFENVAGLAIGADVRVGGVHSGTVRDIVLPHKPGDKITVIMDLGRSTHEIVKQDSVASIETEGMVGSQYLAVSFGSAGAADVRNGDFIASQSPLEMSALLKQASDILNSGQEALQNASRATASLASISAKIDGGQGTVGALVNDKQLYNNLEPGDGRRTRHGTPGAGWGHRLQGKHGSPEAQLPLARILQEPRLRRFGGSGKERDPTAAARHAYEGIHLRGEAVVR